ncbi:MAG: SusC/RagA family TonB-linked outer membrane protein [Dysgonamonadaceae bacterium]|jgi:TonB-linked SusC/RagA family outer membrane protein|nr:SusC/RagA family TonB-linked outer membrane protein [Dysgonamonadaceae bacterium]
MNKDNMKHTTTRLPVTRHSSLVTLLIIILSGCFQTLSAQQADIIVGKVFSKSDGELIGVSVKEVDATNRVISGTVSDVNGDFSLRIKSSKNKLEVSYLGFKTQTLAIGDKKNFSIEMREETQSLDEVVVTAKKRVNTGALSIPEREASMAMQTLKADFQSLSVASLDEALQGQISGLDIIANSGDVGSGSAMRLRGTASINADVTPLIVVNDLIYDAAETDAFDFVNASNESFANLLSINVDDIENISVMKDGAATAMWGSRGANGVISIRTRKGIKGPPRLQYTYRLSEKWQPEGMKMLNGDEYTMLMKEAYFNPMQSDASSDIKEFNYIRNDAVFPDWRMYDNNTDWVGAVKTRGVTNDHYITLSGGGERATFYLSGGYYNEKGSIIGQNLDRYTSRMDLNYNVSDRILFASEMAFTYTNEDKNYHKLLEIAYKKMPNLGIYREDAFGNSTGEYYTVPQNISPKLNDQKVVDEKSLYNPVASADLAKNNVKTYRLMPTFSLRYDLIPRGDTKMLQLKALVSFNVNNSSSYAFLPKELSTATWSDKFLNKSDYGNEKSYSTTGRLEMQWMNDFDGDHVVTMLGRAEMNGSSKTWQSENSYGLPSGITSPTTGSYVSDMGSGSSYGRGLSFLYSAHYSYLSKYNMDVVLRHEGNSRFGPKRRFGTFGGLSFRWNIIDEKFMLPVQHWMSMLALRFSMGITGNAPKEDYLHFSRYESWSSYLGTAGIRPVSIRLSDLRWEKVEDKNFGVNLGVFDDLFTLDFNFYDKKTEDLLQENVPIAHTSGFTVYEWQNVGTVRNQGWELYLHLNRFVEIGKFHANFNLNFANNRNTVLELDDIILSRYNEEYNFENGKYMSRLQLGNSLGSIYGFRYKGVYQYSIDNPDWIESGYTLGSAPVARDAAGNIIYDDGGNPVPVYFAYGTTNQLAFQGGDAIYEDINHDGNINELDIVYLGNSNPKFNGGMGLKLTYDRFSVNVYSVFRYGSKIVNAARMNAESMINNNNQSRAVNWRWRKEGDLTQIPRAWNSNAGATPVARNFLGSDRYMEDGSFWRINQLSLNYALPDKWLSKLSVSSVSAFLTIYNLYNFTKYSGVDPEVGYGSWGVSTDNNQTPRAKSFTAGLSIRF